MNAFICAAVVVFAAYLGGDYDKPKDDPAPPPPVSAPAPPPPPGECPKDKFDPTPCTPGVWAYQEGTP